MGGNPKFLVDDKKRSLEILADENGKFFREKGTFFKFSRKSQKFSKIGEKSETGGNASWPQRGWTPLNATKLVTGYIDNLGR